MAIIALVFEGACDLHIMKDVIQFPLALATSIQGQLIVYARPNNRQSELQETVFLKLLGISFPENEESFSAGNFSTFKHDKKWHDDACEQAAVDKADYLIIYPFFCDPLSSAKRFKLKCLQQFRSGKVILKTDGTINSLLVNWISSAKKIFKSWLLFDRIITETTPNSTHWLLKRNIISFQNSALPIYYELKDIPAIPSRKRQILFVGRLSDPDKGVSPFVRQIASHAQNFLNWRFLFVGTSDKDFKNFHISVLNNTGINFEWIDFVQPEDLKAMYLESRLVVMPSIKEGSPISLLEAILCGCNVIVTDVGTMASTIKEKKLIANSEDEFLVKMLHIINFHADDYLIPLDVLDSIRKTDWLSQIKKLNL